VNVESAFQAVALVFVAIGGSVVVLTREPRQQALVLSVYGMLLTILFMALQAPDVALSELAVGTAALPLMLLVALGILAKPTQAPEPPDEEKNP
jgi:energy-converting hydrogenase B subunit D